MAALTQSAVNALLGLLTAAIRDEARLIGGVHRNFKFIKDEMDSMNGFLLHLSKFEGEHDDLVRAWMKQVREVAYIAEDLTQRYLHVMPRHGDRLGDGCAGCVAKACLFCFNNKKYYELHKLGKQIKELKTRVLEVGERRQRYDVKVHAGREVKRVHKKLSAQEEETRETFVQALEEELEEDVGGVSDDMIGQLRPALPVPSDEAATATIRGILNKCSPPDQPASATIGGSGGAAEAEAEARAFRCTKKMFLCALYVYPYSTDQELQKLKEGVEAPGVAAQEARNQVMVFCYSMLSTDQKKCLLYLTAYLEEPEMSRTSTVRRWVAEGCVGKEPGEERSTPEEAGERCFRELLLRGFVRAARWSDTGTVKSCVMDGPVQDFIDDITKSENFLGVLPSHLQRQRMIRSKVRDSASKPLRPQPDCCGGGTFLDDPERVSMCWTWKAATTKSRMDELVDFIEGLPEIYRLNVLDLEGGKGLKSRHLKKFGEVNWLKYLSLRDTDVSGLHVNHINRLKLLETLDIRGTNIPPRDTKKINLPNLKHLLAGRFTTTMPAASGTTADVGSATTMPAASGSTADVGSITTLVAVHMPDKIGSMTNMETLSHVQVSTDGAELRGVAKLHQLRKLGVVVHADNTTAALLGRLLHKLAGSLRTLSVWVVDTGTLNIPSCEYEIDFDATRVLENLDIKGKMSLPSWIEGAGKLANVSLGDTEMDGGVALRRLAEVPSLRCLKLSRKAFTQQELHFEDVQFQALRVLVIEGDAFTRVVFSGDAAAPKLEKIAWTIGGGSAIAQTLDNEELIVGIQHLPRLKEIELRSSFQVNNLLDWTRQQTTPANPRYRIRYISSTDRKQITELPKAATDTTLTLPAGVIN